MRFEETIKSFICIYLLTIYFCDNIDDMTYAIVTQFIIFSVHIEYER
jgi:hypothetical protein